MGGKTDDWVEVDAEEVVRGEVEREFCFTWSKRLIKAAVCGWWRDGDEVEGEGEENA